MAIAEAQRVTQQSGSPVPAATDVRAQPEVNPVASVATLRDTLDTPPNGTRQRIEDTERVFFEGYWVRYYAPTEDSWAGRKTLIDSLTRRAFHHTEPGINTPGRRLIDARTAYENQTDPSMKRVNAAMLAGALFNRATDLFTRIVELEEQGVKLSRDNELMQACGDCFQEALELGTQVKHHSGEEGIDELWGEPFRAFTIPVDMYYESRFIKVAQTMANIDYLARLMGDTLGARPEFDGLVERLDAFAAAAKKESETMKSDPCIFHIWPRFVATGEHITDVKPQPCANCSRECQYVLENAYQTLIAGRNLINWVARARVPMPESTRQFTARCEALKAQLEQC